MEKIIGLDLGTTSLGIAEVDALGISVHGVENFRFEPHNYKKAREKVLSYCYTNKINKIVLGYPLNMDGSEGERAKSTKRFKDDLIKENPNLEIFLIDERLTTVEAYERMNDMGIKLKKQKEIIDMVSAIIILETYLNKEKNK